jgi:hypothetical protein
VLKFRHIAKPKNGISAAKQRFARQTGIPTTQSGLERKVGRGIISLLLSLFTGKR